MNILICDDHLIFADALAAVLAGRGYTVVAITGSPQDAVEVLRRERVDVAVFDFGYPDGDLLGWLPLICAAAPGTGILLVTGETDRSGPAAALAAGVHGVAYKGQSVHELTGLIDRVHAGQALDDSDPDRPELRRVPPRPGVAPARGSSGTAPVPVVVPVVVPVLVPVVVAPAGTPAPSRLTKPSGVGTAPLSRGNETHRLARFLSQREREVLQRLVRGEDTSSLARSMGITRYTARSHIQSVLTKLGVHSRMEAATMAVRHQLVSPDDGRWLLG
jgi:two-component system, NarL family, nitrate/nitrite response regulator NarL